MIRHPLLAKATGSARSAPTTIGLPLACLWALHAAATYVPGAGYFRLPIVFAMAAGLLVWRVTSKASRPRFASKCGVTAGLCCWFVAATLSTILNSQTDQVVFTYVVVFLAGGAIFVALSGVSPTTADLDIAVAGLAIGMLVPMIGGLLAFVREWGIPDLASTISAWQNIERMQSYADATFGNRGGTAFLLVIVSPLLFSILFNNRKRLGLRTLCGATLVPIVLNLLILQVRAAFLTLTLALVVTWVFQFGTRRLPLLATGLVAAYLFLFSLEPDIGFLMTQRLLPVLTVNVDEDESVLGHAEAIKEGWGIAEKNWLLGIGPGAGLTVHSRDSAHQFQVQQAMETGILGFVGSILFSVGVLVSLWRTIRRSRRDEITDTRFALLIGPASAVVFSIVANATLNNSSVNTWAILIASMVALTPPFERAAGAVRTRHPLVSREIRLQTRQQPAGADAVLQS